MGRNDIRAEVRGMGGQGHGARGRVEVGGPGNGICVGICTKANMGKGRGRGG